MESLRWSSLLPLLAMPVLLVAVQVLALLFATPFQSAGVVAFEDPESYANPVIFIAILLAFTLLLLVLLRHGQRKIISIIIAASIFLTLVYIFGAIVFALLGDIPGGFVLALLLSAMGTFVLYYYPEWYVIDSLGLLIAAGAASIFGISLDVVPVILLLVALAVYDAISVYKTRHMITLAEGVIADKAPILFIIPKRRDFSYRREEMGKIGEGERGAFIMGMGDLIMPSILVVSANMYTREAVIGTIAVPALGAMAGSLIGLVVLLAMVVKGKPQAGLPPLNGGAIIGFLVAYGLVALIL
ncbi:MAG: presenilin family intramembrane aspartyl protease [Methanomicrobiales archaeon]|nr:presenilin family intramembrane aspartyl protease [Methanomicrobiales archaeon]